MQDVIHILSGLSQFPSIDGEIMHGDMPGDKIEINDSHREKAALIFPILVE